jgi:hypothetical protein
MHLKRKLARSKARVNSVHFGVPFENLAEDLSDVIYGLSDDPLDRKPRNTQGSMYQSLSYVECSSYMQLTGRDWKWTLRKGHIF